MVLMIELIEKDTSSPAHSTQLGSKWVTYHVILFLNFYIACGFAQIIVQSLEK